MESSILKQAGRFLREQKNNKRRMAIFLGLAAAVSLGTVAALTYQGQAMTHQERVLSCAYEVHQHTESCYTTNEQGEKVLTCGLADYVVHMHNDDCYDKEGVLVCQLPEVEKHVHTDACYQETKTLTCDLEESAGHVHDENCYTKEQGDLICELPEHTHAEECYAEDGTLICELEEHIHNEECYAWNDVLTCGIPEGDGAHTHTDECYTTEKNLVCGQLEEHVHDENTCYEVLPGVDNDNDGKDDKVLTCTIPVLEEHAHTEDCFKMIELTDEEVAGLNGTADGSSDAADGTETVSGSEPADGTEAVSGSGPADDPMPEEPADSTDTESESGESQVFFTDEESDGTGTEPEYLCGLAEHTHDESCVDEGSGELTCGLTEHTHDESCLAPAEDAGGETESTSTPDDVADDAAAEEAGNEDATVSTNDGEQKTGTDAASEDPADTEKEPVYICGKEEHTHSASCRDAAGSELICGKEAHVHDESCLAPETDEEEQDEEEPVYYCGLEEHTHENTCYDEAGELICGLEEHTHDETCEVEPIYYCGMIEHTHDENCDDPEAAAKLREELGLDDPESEDDGNMTEENGAEAPDEPDEDAPEADGSEETTHLCGLPEHVHTEECKEIPTLERTYEDETIRVTASYPLTANIPDSAEFRVTQIKSENDPEHYEERMQQAVEAVGSEVSQGTPMCLLNIGFYLPDGTELIPAKPVNLTLQFLNEAGATVGDPITIVHFSDTGTELLPGTELDENSATSFTTSSFSEYVPVANTGNGTAPISEAGTGGDSESGIDTDFIHEKTIDYLGDNGADKENTDNRDTDADDAGKEADDLYRIYLNMDGKRQPVDLLIVVDRSSSMKNPETGPSRSKRLDELLNGTPTKTGLVKQFLSSNATKKSEEEKNKLAVVWYAGKYATVEYGGKTSRDMDAEINPKDEGEISQEWTTKSDITITNIGHTAIPGCLYNTNTTNYVAGYWYAHKMLNEVKDDGHKKVVIFISDGLPTQYYDYGKLAAVWDNSLESATLTRFGAGSDLMVYKDRQTNPNSLPNKNEPVLIYDYATKLAQERNTNIVGELYSHDQGGPQSWAITEGTQLQVTPSKEGETEAEKKARLAYDAQYSPYINENEKAFDLFYKDHKDVEFFTIGIDMDTEQDSFDRTYVLDYMANKYGHKTYEVNTTVNPDDLEKALREIIFPTGVTITDELSTYVDFLAENPDVLVTATPRDTVEGLKALTLWKGSEAKGSNQLGTIYGEAQADNKTEDGLAIIDSVTVNGKVIRANFNPNYSLGADYIYALSFNVRVTEEAFNRYAALNGGYDDTGQEATDYKLNGNSTSSLQKGFFSNKHAQVNYFIDGQGGFLEYPMPVVQVWSSDLQIKKQDDAGKVLSNVPFKLQWNNGLTEEEDWTVICPVEGVPEGEDGFYLTNEDGVIKYGKLQYGTYELWEKIPSGYKDGGTTTLFATFTVEKGRIKDATSVDSETGGRSLAMTETKEAADVQTNTNVEYHVSFTLTNPGIRHPLKIYKKDDSNEFLVGAVFDLYLAEQKDGEWTKGGKVPGEWGWPKTSDSQGMVFNGTLPYGNYILEEISAPEGYELYSGEILIEVGQDEVKISPLDKESITPQISLGEEGTAKVVTLTVTNKKKTLQFKLVKKDNQTGGVLSGAEFSLYRAADCDPNTGKPKPDVRPMWEGVSNDEGNIVDVKDQKSPMPPLVVGETYYLVETKAPDGYNSLEGAIKIMIDVNGNVSIWKYVDGEFKPLTCDEYAEDKMDGVLIGGTVTVYNSTGYTLPESGGMGTTPLYTLGALLLAAAVSAYLYKNFRERRAGPSGSEMRYRKKTNTQHANP